MNTAHAHTFRQCVSCAIYKRRHLIAPTIHEDVVA